MNCKNLVSLVKLTCADEVTLSTMGDDVLVVSFHGGQVGVRAKVHVRDGKVGLVRYRREAGACFLTGGLNDLLNGEALFLEGLGVLKK